MIKKPPLPKSYFLWLENYCFSIDFFNSSMKAMIYNPIHSLEPISATPCSSNPCSILRSFIKGGNQEIASKLLLTLKGGVLINHNLTLHIIMILISCDTTPTTPCFHIHLPSSVGKQYIWQVIQLSCHGRSPNWIMGRRTAMFDGKNQPATLLLGLIRSMCSETCEQEETELQ